MRPIFHLVPASYYHRQPADRAYLPETFAQDGFIHCTAGLDTLVEVANMFFADLPDDLLVLEIDPARLTAPLKFEPPVPPSGAADVPPPGSEATLFPHIYGPLNREAVSRIFTLSRSPSGRWALPD